MTLLRYLGFLILFLSQVVLGKEVCFESSLWSELTDQSHREFAINVKATVPDGSADSSLNFQSFYLVMRSFSYDLATFDLVHNDSAGEIKSYYVSSNPTAGAAYNDIFDSEFVLAYRLKDDGDTLKYVGIPKSEWLAYREPHKFKGDRYIFSFGYVAGKKQLGEIHFKNASSCPRE